MAISKSHSFQKILENSDVHFLYKEPVHVCRPDGLGTITVDERQRFEDIRSRLRALLEHQITHFR